MTPDERAAHVAARCVAWLPPTVRARIERADHFDRDLARYAAMADEDLHRVTVVCLHNLERIDDMTPTADLDLRAVLVPELWQRLRPDSRDVLRRMTTTIAEYRGDRPSVFGRLLGAEWIAALRARGQELRDQIRAVAQLDHAALAEATRFAVARSRAAKRWSPCACVYEPGFTYRLVPALVDRVVQSAQLAIEACTDPKEV